jgi:hypothetical protein
MSRRATRLMGVSSATETVWRMARTTRSLQTGILAVAAAVVFLAGCTSPGTRETTAAARPRDAPPAVLHGEAARAALAVDALARALRAGDIERLCRPGGIFTPSVVATMNEGGESCEASLERSPALTHPPTLTVTRLAFEPGLARARVHVGRGATIPLDIVRSSRRWLVSFSAGTDPVAALR